MNGTWIRLTRSELHQRVWAAPIKKVAQELGVSASSLANACRKHTIPLPSVGHWTKVEVGHKITPTPLLTEPGANEVVQIQVRERLSPDLATVAAEHQPQVPIPQELSHALALRTEKLLASGKEDDRKLLVPKAGTAPHLLVSRQQLPRALRIMNALLIALEEQGHATLWPKKEGDHLAVDINGETVAVSLQEILDGDPHVLTPAEEKHPWRAPKWDYKLTGRLRLSIDNPPHSSDRLRATWADGRVQIVENCIGDFIVGINVVAAAIKKNRLEREAWARRWEQERKQREEQQRRAEEHKRRSEFVTGLIEKWEEATRVRTFVTALTEAASQMELSDDKKRDIQQVLEWSEKYADFLDPLTDLPESIDEFVHPERKYPWMKRTAS
jgi:hypothetical protein